jgi:hypothetical protein
MWSLMTYSASSIQPRLVDTVKSAKRRKLGSDDAMSATTKQRVYVNVAIVMLRSQARIVIERLGRPTTSASVAMVEGGATIGYATFAGYASGVTSSPRGPSRCRRAHGARTSRSWECSELLTASAVMQHNQAGQPPRVRSAHIPSGEHGRCAGPRRYAKEGSQMARPQRVLPGPSAIAGDAECQPGLATAPAVVFFRFRHD